MDLSIILMIIGIIVIIVSFFVKDGNKQLESDVEELSLHVYQETHQLKRRLKVIEEELMIEPRMVVKKKTEVTKPVHEILVNQVLALHKQGYSIAEICKRSSLTELQVRSVISTGGGNA